VHGAAGDTLNETTLQGKKQQQAHPTAQPTPLVIEQMRP